MIRTGIKREVGLRQLGLQIITQNNGTDHAQQKRLIAAIADLRRLDVVDRPLNGCKETCFFAKRSNEFKTDESQ